MIKLLPAWTVACSKRLACWISTNGGAQPTRCRKTAGQSTNNCMVAVIRSLYNFGRCSGGGLSLRCHRHLSHHHHRLGSVHWLLNLLLRRGLHMLDACKIYVGFGKSRVGCRLYVLKIGCRIVWSSNDFRVAERAFKTVHIFGVLPSHTARAPLPSTGIGAV